MALTIVSCVLSAALSCALTLVCVGLALARKNAHKDRQGEKRRCPTSHLIALGILAVDGVATFAVLYWLHNLRLLRLECSISFLT